MTSDFSALDPRQDPQAATRAGKMTVPNEAKAGPNDPNEASRVGVDGGKRDLRKKTQIKRRQTQVTQCNLP